MKDKLSFMGKTRDELIEENQKLQQKKQVYKEEYYKLKKEFEDVRRELEGYKKKVDKVTQIIWEYHTIHGSLSTDFVIKEVEKLKEVKRK